MAQFITFQPKDYFNTKLYTGNGGTQSITGVGFQPDWCWIKNRNQALNPVAIDSVRGLKYLYTNSDSAEGDYSSAFTSFDSDGFSVGATDNVNGNGNGIVAWNWKAGTSVSGNTGGSGTAKTYTGSVNTDAGFSIIRYIGNRTAGHTIPHHLGTTPVWVIARTISSTKEWDVYHHKNTSSPETDYLVLNTTAATSDASDKWNDTAPTSSVVTLGDSSQLNTNDGTCIMYAFAEKKGYSKFGSYVGNGSTEGPFVYTGFRPAWIMIKAIDATKSWYMWDSKRPGFNLVDDQLLADTNDTEFNGSNIDILSNGWKFRSSGTGEQGNGTNYIFMAFAEFPFVTSGTKAAGTAR